MARLTPPADHRQRGATPARQVLTFRPARNPKPASGPPEPRLRRAFFMSEETFRILARLDQIEALLVQATGRRPPDRSICSWAECARLLGIEGDPQRAARAAAKRLHRLALKPDGPSLKLYRNGALRADLARLIDLSGKPSTSDQIRAALAPSRRRGARS